MKGKSLSLLALLLAAPLSSYAAEQLIPAGSLISCTLSEPKLSSKNTAVGDPVLCQLGHAERYGRSVLPFGSYLVGRFEDGRDHRTCNHRAPGNGPFGKRRIAEHHFDFIERHAGLL